LEDKSRGNQINVAVANRARIFCFDLRGESMENARFL